MKLIIFLILSMFIMSLKPNYTNPSSDELTTAINKIRKDNGLKPLTEDVRLNHSAFDKANDMLNKNYWSHIDPQGKPIWEKMKQEGYDYQYAGENLANKYDNKGSVDAWMKSEFHKKNILNSHYANMGVGRAGDFTVVHFGKE